MTSDEKSDGATFGGGAREVGAVRPKDATRKENARKPSLRDIEPVSVGKILQPLGTRDQWYDEMRKESA